MARFVKHTACPKCQENGRDRKGNNLGVYDDGSCYCFSCGYSNGSSVPIIRVQEQREDDRPILALPDDVEPIYPSCCVDWFAKYELTVEDLYVNKCLWSKLFKRLIFPYYQDSSGTLFGWQGRYFGEDTDKPKWFGRGPLDTLYHIFNRESKGAPLVITEDVVSAYKISKVMEGRVRTMPLFGSHISPKKMLQLKLLSDRIILWLDPDKIREAVKFSSYMNSISLPCRVVNSEVDPKECSAETIMQFLGEEKYV